MDRLKVFFHDNCFDGTASAALFVDFYKQKINADVNVILQGMHHEAGDPFSSVTFCEGDNVCLDFRYTDAPQLTWWFDHHVSAFQPTTLKDHFDKNQNGQKFYDPTAQSCTKFEATMLAEKFGYDSDLFTEVIHWADLIDGAKFENAEAVVALKNPVYRLMTWVEQNQNKELSHRYINTLGTKTLEDIVKLPWINKPLESFLEKHERNIELIRQVTTYKDGVTFFDLSDQRITFHNKFIPYMLFPETRYAIGITCSKNKVKISIGANPWPTKQREHNIAQICERYGGGGHPMVGAISMSASDVEVARDIAKQVAQELSIAE